MKTVTIEQWERLTIEVTEQTDGPPLIRIEGTLHPAQAAQVCDALATAAGVAAEMYLRDEADDDGPPVGDV
jgi:hypothetical protein